MIDFRTIICAPGSLLVVRKGRAHNFGPHEIWDGWIVLFSPEFVLFSLAPVCEIPFAVDLARLQGEAKTLLLHQLHALTRLGLLQDLHPAQEALRSLALQRFGASSNWWRSASGSSTRWPATHNGLGAPKKLGPHHRDRQRHHCQGIHRGEHRPGS